MKLGSALCLLPQRGKSLYPHIMDGILSIDVETDLIFAETILSSSSHRCIGECLR